MDLFPDVIAVNKRNPEAEMKTVLDETEIRHRRDQLYSRLSSSMGPVGSVCDPASLNKLLIQYIQFCKSLDINRNYSKE